MCVLGQKDLTLARQYQRVSAHVHTDTNEALSAIDLHVTQCGHFEIYLSQNICRMLNTSDVSISVGRLGEKPGKPHDFCQRAGYGSRA